MYLKDGKRYLCRTRFIWGGGIILNVIFKTNKRQTRMNSSGSEWGPVRFVNTAMNLQDSVRRKEFTQIGDYCLLKDNSAPHN